MKSKTSRTARVAGVPAFWLAIDDFRRQQPDIPTRPEAIRRLVAAGLAAPKRADPIPALRFDKTAYQRDYMRMRRAAARAKTAA